MRSSEICSFDFAGGPNAGSWHHFEAEHTDVANDLLDLNMNIPEVAINSLLAKDTRPRFTRIANGFVFCIRGVNLNENADPEDMVSLRMWSDGVNIVSVRKRKLKAVSDIRALFEQGKELTDVYDFLEKLMSFILQNIEPIIKSIELQVDEFEEKYIQSEKSIQLDSVNAIHRQAIILISYLLPQKQAIQSFVQEVGDDETTKQVELQNEHLNKLRLFIESLEQSKARVNLIKEDVVLVLSQKMNRNMYMLSIVAAVFLPLSFLTGLLGINVAGIPGAENPQAFALFSIILLVVVVIQLIIFKKNDWF